ncbi:hypothetical protein F5141DRAFT_1068556 [Pisolithus sp. B1]|nr:hypothetical protein F5141DRAFT_1068556 [Pisolithus sp. B1]
MVSSCSKAMYSTLPLFLPVLKVSRLVLGSFPPYCCIIVGWHHSYINPEELCAMGPVHWVHELTLNVAYRPASKISFSVTAFWSSLVPHNPPAFCTARCTPILNQKHTPPTDCLPEPSIHLLISFSTLVFSTDAFLCPKTLSFLESLTIVLHSQWEPARNWVTVHSQRSTSLHDFASAVESIGPPIGARRSKRIQATMLSSTKTQPSHGAKAHHPMNQPAVATRSCDTAPEPCPWRSSQGLTTEECKEQYLNSFCTKIVVLKDGTKLDQCTALKQLHKGAITVQDIDIEDGCEQSGPLDMSLDAHPPDEDDHHESSLNLPSENVSNDQSMQSEEDEWAIENVMQSKHADVPDLGEVNHASDAEDEHAASPIDEPSDSDWSVTKRCRLKCKQTAREILTRNYDIDTHPSPLDFPTSSEDTMDIEDTVKYRKPKRKSDCVLTKASEAPDLDQEDEPGTNPKTSDGVLLGPDLVLENLKDYYYCQMKYYESHKDEEEFPDLWVETRKFWSESISGTKDMSSKAMVGWLMTCRDSFMQAVQTWCNVENIHVFGCVIYTGNDEAARQAQGIFAGSSLCMQLADIARLLDYLTTIIKYKVLNSAATIPLPTFAMLSGRSYDHVLALKPQESTCDRNRHVLPLVVLHKLYQVEITCGQRNVPWKTLLDLLFTHKYVIVDWPAGVPAISQHFNVKCLTADELNALTVPFLKEQMGNDYHMETRIDDDDEHGDYIVPEPALSFSLKPWTADQLALVHMMNPKASEIPLVMDTFGQPLHLLSDSQAFLKVVPRGIIVHDILPPAPAHQCHTPATTTTISHKSVTWSIRRIEKDPPQVQ